MTAERNPQCVFTAVFKTEQAFLQGSGVCELDLFSITSMLPSRNAEGRFPPVMNHIFCQLL